MKKSLVLLILIIMCMFILSSCESDSTKPNDGGKLSGIVTNADNEAIEGAKILLSYHYEDVERSETMFNFTLDEPTYIKAWITRLAQVDTIKTLINETIDAGCHQLVWNGNNEEGMHVYNDSYDFHLIINSEERITNFILLANFNNVTGDFVEKYESHAVTDSNGKYSLSTENLLMYKGLEPIHYTTPDGTQSDGLIQISKYAKVWALHADYEPAFIDSVYIKQDKNVKVNLKFEE